MKRTLASGITALLFTMPLWAWSPQGDKIKTPWAEKVTPENVWKEYPRPQLKRSEWVNLNGLWQYAVTGKSAEKKQVKFNGQILVPFAIESALSGVAQTFTPDDKLWYRREFTIDTKQKKQRIILHFGAVDYKCQIWVNNKPAGDHQGGNNPFSFDITGLLNKNGTQVLEISVTDPTDTESVTRGKQQLNQRGIWYTPVSGIWQTVWLESVDPTHIRTILPQADIAGNRVKLSLDIAGLTGGEQITINVKDEGKIIRSVEQPATKEIDIALPEITLWTPETPKLYKLEIKLGKKNQIVDEVESYFAMREISTVTDDKGYKRIGLNGKPIFQYGTLDQGWWPDGLLTPPSAEAMRWDMIQLKKMGFNTIRKHIKVEPALYYYYADSLGMMIWQDMPSGYATPNKDKEFVEANVREDWNAPAGIAAQRQTELDEMIDRLRFFPSITTWVIFNEGWGQHNTRAITERTMQKDPTRLIDGVSGWAERFVGNLYDIHNYPATTMIFPDFNNNRISVLGEFGGLGLPVENHLWNPDMHNWGYKNMDGSMDFINDYTRLVYDLESLIAQGLSAAIYTQTTDVEGEVNGLMTYDRSVIKISPDFLNLIHSRLYEIPSAKTVTLIADGQNSPVQDRDVVINKIPQKTKTPFEISGPATISSAYKFNADKCYKHLSLWINVNGFTSIKLNGQTVFEQPVRYTRHYNQYNISNFARYLQKGENTFEIEVVQEEDKMNFDFGLTAY